ncbi:MAG: hypothetical protein K9L73_07735 [Spirochaetia bacterium]|nr:hypothetical protein [Spirochaetia bacterium]
MNAVERMECTLDHREPDKVPLDLGGHLITGIHAVAYRNLLDHLGLQDRPVTIERYRQQTARIDEDILERFGVDTRPIVPPVPDLIREETARQSSYYDEWGIRWKKDQPDGLYYELESSRFETMPDLKTLQEMRWPDFSLPKRIAGMKERYDAIEAIQKVPIVDLPLGLEVFDVGFNLCGFVNFYMLLSLDPSAAGYLMDRQVDAQIQWWTQVIDALPSLRLIRIGDDLGSQSSTLIDPEMYRSQVKPRHRRLFKAIKAHSNGRVKIIMHSDGAILPLIPDLIEVGVDCLNPIQYTVHGIDPAALKKTYGKDLVLWGGGVDTQSVLPSATPAQVRDEVHRQIDIMAPGGGFVFSQVHITQADVPPENIIAMLEAVNEFR